MIDLGTYGKYFVENGTVDKVEDLISKAGNRSERRKILKALNKTTRIAEHANKKIRADANEELAERANESFGYIMSMFGIVLHDKYGWEDEQVEEMFTEVSERLSGKWSEGKTVDDVAQELFEKTGIELVVK